MEDKYISMNEFLMGRATMDSLPDDLKRNARDTVVSVNELLEEFHKEYPEAPKRTVNSGYRRPEDNAATPGAAPKSKHMICAACDLKDDDKLLGEFCMKNLDKLKEIGLWMESLDTTHAKANKWIHVQIIPPKSKSNPFNP